MKDLIPYYFGLGFITIPLTIFITYIIVTEFLDLIFNTGKINRLLKHADLLNFDLIEKQHTTNKGRQLRLDHSNLIELDRQIKYIRQSKYNSWTKEKYKITAAKELADVFKIR